MNAYLQNLLFFLSTLGWFNGIILCFIFFRKSKLLSNKLLGFVLLLLCIRVGKSTLWWFIPNIPVIIIQIGLGACFLVGPVFLYYIIASQKNLSQLPQSWRINLILHILAVVFVLVFLTKPTDLGLWKRYLAAIIYLQWMGYTLVSGYQMRHLVKKFMLKSELTTQEKWLLAIFTSIFLLVFTYALSFFKIFNVAYISGPLIFSLMLYLNLIFYFNRTDIDTLSSNKELKYQNKKIDDTEAAQIMQALNALLEESAIFKKSDLKIQDVAKNLNITAHKLSQILNDNYAINFPNFINNYRIEASCKLIIEKHHLLTLEAIGNEVGFNSKSTFFTLFKKIKGITPNEYRESLKMEKMRSDL